MKAEAAVRKSAGAEPALMELIGKTIVAHTLTYMVVGMLAFWLLDYATAFAAASVRTMMRQTNEPIVMAGPLFQPVRGVLFGLVFYLLRESLFKKRGWLTMWAMLVIVGVIGTFGPSPGSLEGVIYTTLPLSFQLRGLPEVILQALLLSLLVHTWVIRAPKKWLNWTLGVAFILALLLPALGLLATRANV